MCPNYRELNKMTIKNKFPILVIDEFQGYIFFTKLDFHCIFHQIRMRQHDIPKIYFRIHEVHYLFLVMSIGLTNAPPTFQIWTILFSNPWKICVIIF